MTSPFVSLKYKNTTTKYEVNTNHTIANKSGKNVILSDLIFDRHDTEQKSLRFNHLKQINKK